MLAKEASIKSGNIIRILFITRAHGEAAGGMERLNYEMIQALQFAGVATQVIAHRGSRYTAPFFVLTCLPQALWKARNVDAVHLGDPLLAAVAWLLKKFYRVPIITTVHGLDITYPNHVYQWYLRIFLTSSTAVIAISPYVKKLLIDKKLHQHIEVITPAITDRLSNSRYTKTDLQKLLPVDVFNNITLITTGRLTRRKGHAWFIGEVLPSLPTNVHYIIAGEGPEKETILETAKQAKVAQRVHLLGRISDDQLAVLTNTADAFVQPNIKVENDVEGFGLVLIEATICGRPVFAADTEGIPAAIHHGKNGYLLPAQDPRAWITSLTNFTVNPNSYNPKPVESRQYTQQHFTWSTQLARYLGFFQKLTRQSA